MIVSLTLLGWGPIMWVYSFEIFPLQLRTQGCSMGVAVNKVTSRGQSLEDMKVLFGKYHKGREANAMFNKTKQADHGFGDDNKAQIH
ncbi:hypothetical protein PS2_003037 [Malus domestica]